MIRNFLFFCIFISFCTSCTDTSSTQAELSQETHTTTVIPIITKSQFLTETPIPSPSATITSIPSPSPTRIPRDMQDPDDDGFPSLFEMIWNTDPMTYTSFDDLSHHKGTIYAVMEVSQPFDIEEMNGTIYQVARLLKVDDKGTSSTSDDRFTFEIVMFPYAKFLDSDIRVHIDSFPIPNTEYPFEVQGYLESTEHSDISDELREIMLDIVNNSTNNVQAIDRILSWNLNNLTLYDFPRELYFYEIIDLKASDMIRDRKTWYSTSRATLITAELRSIGIPTKLIYGVYVTDESNNTPPGIYDHAQSLVYMNGHWVRLDYFVGLNYSDELSDPFSYGYLAFTDTYRDTSEPDWATTIFVIDQYHWQTSHQQRCWILHKPLELKINR